MATSLVIVESPAKANTIKKYLGKGFQVKASIGHVNYLAPDPDREGEAIAWHIYEDVKKKNKHIYRVLFNEITKKAVLDAIAHPQSLNQDKYQAQQARRILDRLVGYQISPILWDKVRMGLSAGRVQSVSLRLVVDREREIQVFKPEEYWSIVARLSFEEKEFDAKLVQINGQKVEINTEQEAKAILKALQGASFLVISVVKKERRKNPLAPFITSKLQQDAAHKLGFTAKKTMTLAQMLYEGIELGSEGAHGLITYMRTDSTRLSNEAVSAVRDYIVQKYGKEYLPAAPNIYKSQKAAQEAHEAIRPTSVEFPPDIVKPYLDKDLFRLYELIWNRFVACQMSQAILDQTTLNIEAGGKHLFRATGQVVKFNGFLAVYQEEREEIQRKKGEEEAEGDAEKLLPPVKEKDVLDLQTLTPNQHFTEPPPRFAEASLVKALEENGIGRPSTYASILAAIQDREYVEKKENRFYSTELGQLVTELLVKSFPEIMDVEFTAGMEEKLDLVEEGKVDWVKMLKDFYEPFSQTLKKAKLQMRDVKKEEMKTEHICDKCKSPMVVKWGRRGKFLACSSYPECKNTKEIAISESGKVEIQAQEVTDEKCDKCSSPLMVKQGRFGRFLACSKYPDCKFTKSYTLGISCPLKGCGGEIVEKRSRGGKVFFSCSNYPKCKFATWYAPVKKPCPSCKAPFLVLKTTKTEGAVHFCLDKDCGYKEEVA
ncbi:MAG: type I DNA topoisomerase [Deltaproteobacteria bacterium]|nr:type I DNA topoisomerase [Deltaproteobacteria bacterium]